MKMIEIGESRGDRRLAGMVLGLAGVSLAVVAFRAVRLGVIAGWQGVKAIKSAVAPGPAEDRHPARPEKP